MIEVGEYVRTNDGRIFRVYKIDNKNPDYTLYSNEFTRPINYKIVKHSKNIIDLIELGDILEIELSEEFVEKEDKKILTQMGAVYTKETLQKDIDNGIITKILTILTKEQYTQNCYKIDTN